MDRRLAEIDAAWSRLEAAAAKAEGRSIAGLFPGEPDRLSRLSVSAAGLDLDLSKQPWSLADLDACVDLARAAGLEAARAALFSGGIVNRSEGRPALHMALRAAKGAGFSAAGQPVSGEVEATREQMGAFAAKIRAGDTRAIVHIGIGGSDLGPR